MLQQCSKRGAILSARSFFNSFLLPSGRRGRWGTKLDFFGFRRRAEYERVRRESGLQVPVGELDQKAREILNARVSHNQIPRQRFLAGLNPDFPMDPATLERKVFARRTIDSGGADNECAGQILG